MLGIAVLLICVIGLSGCNELNRDSRFVGTWKSELSNSTMTFFSDGTYSLGSLQIGTYTIKEGRLKLNIDSDISYVFNYSFSNNDNTLILTPMSGGTGEVFTKQ